MEAVYLRAFEPRAANEIVRELRQVENRQVAIAAIVKASGMRVALARVVLLQTQKRTAAIANGKVPGLRVALACVVLL